jgi:hypothetical protein
MMRNCVPVTQVTVACFVTVTLTGLAFDVVSSFDASANANEYVVPVCAFWTIAVSVLLANVSSRYVAMAKLLAGHADTRSLDRAYGVGMVLSSHLRD